MVVANTRKVIGYFLASSSIAAFLTTGAIAQTKPPVKDSDEQSAKDIVVTGTRVEEVERGAGYRATLSSTLTRVSATLVETPNSVSVVTQDLIRDRGATDVFQMTETVAGVSRQNYAVNNNYDQILIRGLGSGGNNTAFRENNLPGATSYPPDPAIIERLEVIKGPSSIAGGRVSPGGFINRELKGASYNDHTIFESAVDSNGKVRGDVDINRELAAEGDLRGRIVLAATYGDEFFDHVKGYTLSALPSVAAKLGTKTRVKLTLNAHYTHLDDFEGSPVGPDGSDPGVSQRTNLNVSGDFRTVRYLGFSGEAVHDFLDDLQLTVRVGGSDGRIKSQGIYTYGYLDATGNTSLYAAASERRSRTLSGDIYLTKKFNIAGRESAITVGVDNLREHLNLFKSYAYVGTVNIADFNTRIQYAGSGFDVDPGPGVSDLFSTDINVRQTGFYGQAVVRPVEGLTVMGGGRYDIATAKLANATNEISDSNTSLNDKAFTWRLGASFEVAKEFVPYASYSESFLPQPRAFDFNFNPLRPEKGKQYEIGIKSELANKKLLLTAALFRIDRTDVSTLDPDNPRFSIAAGGQRNDGFELEAAGSPFAGLQISAGYSYIDAKITNSNDPRIPLGNRPAGVPRHQLGAFANYEIQNGSLKGLGFGGNVFYRSDVFGTVSNTASYAGYTRVDLNFAYKALKRFELRLNVRNIFDKRFYETPGQGNGFGAQFGASRGAYLSAAYKL